jgi:predicted GNAT superfamily acetyltransferase
MAIAVQGDMEEFIPVDYCTVQVTQSKYQNVGSIETAHGKKLNIMQLIGPVHKFNVGYYTNKNDEVLFAIVAEIEFSKISNVLEYKNVFNVDYVVVANSVQGRGIAKSMYRFFVKTLKMTILGDSEQYFGAKIMG